MGTTRATWVTRQAASPRPTRPAPSPTTGPSACSLTSIGAWSIATLARRSRLLANCVQNTVRSPPRLKIACDRAYRPGIGRLGRPECAPELRTFGETATKVRNFSQREDRPVKSVEPSTCGNVVMHQCSHQRSYALLSSRTGEPNGCRKGGECQAQEGARRDARNPTDHEKASKHNNGGHV